MGTPTLESVGQQELSPDEIKNLMATDGGGEIDLSTMNADGGGAPDWAPPLPDKLKVPDGIQVSFIKIRAKWTLFPKRGDRVCALWPLSELEERGAIERGRDNRTRIMAELAKACIRTVDAHAADRTKTPDSPGDVERFWNDIGPKGRNLVRTYYTRMHTLSDEETMDFLVNCFTTRSAESG